MDKSFSSVSSPFSSCRSGAWTRTVVLLFVGSIQGGSGPRPQRHFTEYQSKGEDWNRGPHWLWQINLGQHALSTCGANSRAGGN